MTIGCVGVIVWQDPTGHLSSALDVPGLLTTPCLRLETSQNGVLSGQSLHGSPSLDRKSTHETKSICISRVWPVREVNKGSRFQHGGCFFRGWIDERLAGKDC